MKQTLRNLLAEGKITQLIVELRRLTAQDADLQRDRKSTRLNSSHLRLSRMPSSA